MNQKATELSVESILKSVHQIYFILCKLCSFPLDNTFDFEFDRDIYILVKVNVNKKLCSKWSAFHSNYV